VTAELAVGTSSSAADRRLVETAYACLMEAIKLCKPGVMYRTLGDRIQQIAGLNGCSVVKSYCGHGVGEFFHCAPNVPHYADNKAVGVMAEGHVFTIEPMINAGTWKDKKWPDDWTAVTADGKKSAQFEHTLLITGDGVEVLTARVGDSPSMGFDEGRLTVKL
jgi:methionyl aminopeptidase